MVHDAEYFFDFGPAILVYDYNLFKWSIVTSEISSDSGSERNGRVLNVGKDPVFQLRAGKESFGRTTT
jgi:hypothetical protein